MRTLVAVCFLALVGCDDGRSMVTAPPVDAGGGDSVQATRIDHADVGVDLGVVAGPEAGVEAAPDGSSDALPPDTRPPRADADPDAVGTVKPLQPCASPDECGYGRACSGGRCEERCVDSYECPAGTACVSHRCQSACSSADASGCGVFTVDRTSANLGEMDVGVKASVSVEVTPLTDFALSHHLSGADITIMPSSTCPSYESMVAGRGCFFGLVLMPSKSGPSESYLTLSGEGQTIVIPILATVR